MEVRLPEYEQVESVRTTGEDTNTKVSNLGGLTQALVSGLQTSVYVNVCRVRVSVNPTGSQYELPTGAKERSELLQGARIVFKPEGVDSEFTCPLGSLENFNHEFITHVTNAGLLKTSRVYLDLGKSESCAFAAAPVAVQLVGGGVIDVNLTTEEIDGEVVEVGRVQVWDPTAADSGASAIITRITGTSGTKEFFGYYDVNGDFVDQSMTKVSVWNCPKDGSVNAERVISDGGSPDAIDIMQRLACLRNIKKVTASWTGDSKSVDGNVFIRYDQVFTKTSMETVLFKRQNSSGELIDEPKTCIVKWFCDVQADSEYHLHPAFERYETQNDGSILSIPLQHLYIARYPIQTENIAINGSTVAVPRSKPDGSREIGNSRKGFLDICRRLNSCSVTISADGEEDIVIEKDSDERFASMCAIPEIDFISAMAYLMFGANVQESLRGICTSAVFSTSNGATDYIVDQGIWTGGENTNDNTKSIVFLGVEDGTWSSTGWMHPDYINLWKRIYRTNADGTVASNTTEHVFLFCQDRAKYNPCSSSKNYDNVTATEEELLLNGYRYVSFTPASSDGYKRRLGYDNSEVMRDAFLPANSASERNINMGGADYMWQGSAPAAVGNFSATTAYAIGTYIMHDSKLYMCTNAHDAGAWNPDNFALQSETEAVLRNWYMVARSNYRNYGAYLGIAFVYASSALSTSNGFWRSRISLQPRI